MQPIARIKLFAAACFLMLFFVAPLNAQAMWSEGAWFPTATGGQPAVSEIPWSALTHIDMVGADPGSGGSITYASGYATDATNLVAAAHAHGVKVMFELTDPSFDPAMIGSCAGPSAMHTFLVNIATAMSTYGFDGIFVDYEQATYNSQFGVFMGCLRAAYPAPKLIEWFAGVIYQIGQFGGGGSATCGPGSAWNVSTATILAIANNADRVSLSTYDIGNPGNGYETTTYFNAALYNANFAMYGNTASADWSVQVAEACGIAASKLMISIPFYADLYTINTAPYQAVNGASSVSQYYYNVIPGGVGGSTQDSTAHVAWKAGSGGYLTWDNAQSITDKIGYVRTNSLGGMMYWTMGMDYNAGSMPLMDAVRAAISTTPAPNVPVQGQPIILGYLRK